MLSSRADDHDRGSPGRHDALDRLKAPAPQIEVKQYGGWLGSDNKLFGGDWLLRAAADDQPWLVQQLFEDPDPGSGARYDGNTHRGASWVCPHGPRLKGVA
jgi:hypothetical protein